MPKTYIQLPPDGTGKKISTHERQDVSYDNVVDVNVQFRINDIIVGATSGATGTVTGINSTVATDGELTISNMTGTWIDNESIMVNSVAIALVNGNNFPVYQLQRFVIVDKDNPHRSHNIDRFGAAVSTFTEGAPVFSPFGELITGEPQIIKSYRFAYGKQESDFWDQQTSGATISWDSSYGSILLSNPTTSGSLASRTSNFYHPYRPGVGSLIEMSISCGDMGKSNVRRRWGLFDNDNGYFWELNGTTMSCVVRSNTSGSPVDNVVSQSNWNVDRLDGSDSISFDIDVSKGNVYWIDFQWLGAGKVRFGVMEPSGSRLTAHIFENANSSTVVPYSRTATLPVRIEQENTGTSGSTSEMRLICAVVKHTTKVPISGQINHFYSSEPLVSISDASGVVPIFSGRPKTVFGGVPNRSLIRLASVTYVNNSTTNAVLFKAGYTDAGLMTGHAFASHAVDSVVEIDESATAITFAKDAGASYIMPRSVERFEFNKSESVHNYELYLNANGVTQPVVSWTAQVVGTGNADVGVILNWEEIVL